MWAHSTQQALLEKSLVLKEINLSVGVLKKMFKLTEIYFITDIVDPADAQCIKVGFLRSGYYIYLYIGAWYVKAVANYADKHLFEYQQAIGDWSLWVAVQKVITNLYDNINRHVQTQLDNSGNKPQEWTNPD